MDTDKTFLDGLYTDNGGFDRQRAEEVLKLVIVGIQREDHMVFFQKNVDLKAEDKILAYALLKKLMKLDGAEEKSSVSGKEIKDKTALKGGTVDSAIKNLKDADGFLLGSGSKYEIPAHKVEDVIERLEKRAEVKK